jgi:hypothetical protein
MGGRNVSESADNDAMASDEPEAGHIRRANSRPRRVFQSSYMG